ncbi:MAG: response regulator [Gammaproteobacteria bacterium]
MTSPIATTSGVNPKRLPALSRGVSRRGAPFVWMFVGAPHRPPRMQEFHAAPIQERERIRGARAHTDRRYPSLNGTKGSKIMRILVVEDEPELRERLKQQLTGTGFGVDVAVRASGIRGP